MVPYERRIPSHLSSRGGLLVLGGSCANWTTGPAQSAERDGRGHRTSVEGRCGAPWCTGLAPIIRRLRGEAWVVAAGRSRSRPGERIDAARCWPGG